MRAPAHLGYPRISIKRLTGCSLNDVSNVTVQYLDLRWYLQLFCSFFVGIWLALRTVMFTAAYAHTLSSTCLRTKVTWSVSAVVVTHVCQFSISDITALGTVGWREERGGKGNSE